MGHTVQSMNEYIQETQTMKIKAISAAAILAIAASSANAGGLMTEVVETEVVTPIVEEESTPLWIPLLALAVVAAVAAGGAGGGS